MRTAAILGFQSQLSSRTGRLSIICHFLCTVRAFLHPARGGRQCWVHTADLCCPNQWTNMPGHPWCPNYRHGWRISSWPFWLPRMWLCLVPDALQFPTQGWSLLRCDIFTVRAKHMNATLATPVPVSHRLVSEAREKRLDINPAQSHSYIRTTTGHTELRCGSQRL